MAYNNNYFGGDTPERDYPGTDFGESRDIMYNRDWPAYKWSPEDKQTYMQTEEGPTYPWEDEQYQDDYYAGESYDPDNPMNYQGGKGVQGYAPGLSETLGGFMGGMGGAENQMSGMLKFLGQQGMSSPGMGGPGMGAGLGGGLNKSQSPDEIARMRQEHDEFGPGGWDPDPERFEFHDPSGRTEQLKDMDYYEQRMGMWDPDKLQSTALGEPYGYSSGEMGVYRNMQDELRRLQEGGQPSNLPEGWEYQKDVGKYGLPPTLKSGSYR